MIRRFSSSAFLCACALVLLTRCSSADPEPEPPSFAEVLQTTLDDVRMSNNIRGISAAVIAPGHNSWQGVSGTSTDGQPITPNMFFGIASITKNYIGALTLDLVEAGVLTLEDPLSRWLPSIANIDSTITVRQLLNHTSGLANYTNNATLFDRLFADPSRPWTPAEILALVEAPTSTPGSDWSYSNTNFVLLGMVIQEATQTSVSANFRDRLFTPLGLTQTFLEVEENIPGPRATPWADLDNDGILEDIASLPREALYSAAWTAGGLVATADNVARWTKALFEGDILSQAQLDQMLTFVTPVSHPAATGYGLGTMAFASSDLTRWGHTGDIFGYASITMYVPERQISIAILANQGLDENVKIALANDLLDAVMQNL